jgi:hypothetical protein|tara:strand:- start:14850 stop:14999 length:150 start_codon:yes stop_codon:yes gene_type:complete
MVQGENKMKIIFIAFFAIAVIAVGANLILKQAGFSSKNSTSGAAVRLDN